MKTVKEIKEVYEWSRAINGFSQNDMNELIFGILIGITEHLEAHPDSTVFQPFCQTVSASDNFTGESVATVSTTCDAQRAAQRTPLQQERHDYYMAKKAKKKVES